MACLLMWKKDADRALKARRERTQISTAPTADAACCRSTTRSSRPSGAGARRTRPRPSARQAAVDQHPDQLLECAVSCASFRTSRRASRGRPAGARPRTAARRRSSAARRRRSSASPPAGPAAHRAPHRRSPRQPGLAGQRHIQPQPRQHDMAEGLQVRRGVGQRLFGHAGGPGRLAWPIPAPARPSASWRASVGQPARLRRRAATVARCAWPAASAPRRRPSPPCGPAGPAPGCRACPRGSCSGGCRASTARPGSRACSRSRHAPGSPAVGFEAPLAGPALGDRRQHLEQQRRPRARHGASPVCSSSTRRAQYSSSARPPST